MQPVTTDAQNYDGITRFFHWATAILVVEQWLGAQVIDWFPRGPLRVDARSTHITFGVLLAALLFARVVWRLTRGRRLALADKGVVNVVAKGTHWGLYALLAAMVLVGMFLTWARGDNLWNLVSLPRFAPDQPGLSGEVQDIHATIGWIIVAFVGLHAAATLVHHYVWRDGVLGRMLSRG
ncbi:MAG: cytochrome b [Acetobacteraceae bacterium]